MAIPGRPAIYFFKGDGKVDLGKKGVRERLGGVKGRETAVGM